MRWLAGTFVVWLVGCTGIPAEPTPPNEPIDASRVLTRPLPSPNASFFAPKNIRGGVDIGVKGADGAVLVGDSEQGEIVFRQCAACHSVTSAMQNRVGPSLYRVVDRKAGIMPGYEYYSPAMQSSLVVWTTQNLFDYLASPRTYILGTRMAFAGIRREQDRANLIAYLILAGQQN